MKKLTGWKRWGLLLLLVLALACAGAAAETAAPEVTEDYPEEDLEYREEENSEEIDGDDSVQLPVLVSEEKEKEETGSAVEIRPLQSGDEGDDVLFLQMRLKNLGYYAGEADGKYEAETAAAVKSFQIDYRDKGLEPTGIADAGTQLLAVNARYRGLRKGFTGADVKELQLRLTELGFYGKKGQNITELYGEGTKNAVKQFQKYNGLEQTGEALPWLQELIYSDTAVGRYDDEEEANATPTPNLDPYYVVSEGEGGVPMPDEPVAFTQELKSGSKQAELVTLLQSRMKELGYYDGPESGNYLDLTRAAVKRIQKQNGMEETGTVDETTWNLIFNDPGLVMPNQTPKPTPKPRYRIIVDVNSQIVTVWSLDENNEYNVMERAMLCSSGKSGTPTPKGEHVLNGRKARWCYFPKWGDYARYWTRINAQVAFHSPIYREASYDALKKASYKALGWKASHGCVRLALEDAKWIYDNAEAGTVVDVRYDLPVDRELRDALLHDKPATQGGEKPVNTPEPEYSRENKPSIKGTIGQGSKDSATVYWIQRRLQELGYYRTRCTGTFKNMTDAAVKDFQADHGYPRSGYVSQELIDLMAEAEKITPTPAPTATPAP